AAHAARRVIHRSQPVGDCLNLLELLAVLVEGILGFEPVRRIVEARRRLVRFVLGLVLNAGRDGKHHNQEPTGGNRENGEPTERGVPSLFSRFSPVLDFFASWSICSRQKSRSAAHERPPWARNQEPRRSWGESSLVRAPSE